MDVWSGDAIPKFSDNELNELEKMVFNGLTGKSAVDDFTIKFLGAEEMGLTPEQMQRIADKLDCPLDAVMKVEVVVRVRK